MGGAQFQAQLLTEHLLSLGCFDIHFLARRIANNFTPEGYTIHKIGSSTGPGFLFDARNLLRTLNTIRPHTIYQHVGCAYTGISAYYCKRHTCNLVWHIASDIDVERAHFSLPGHFSLHYLDKKILEYGLRNAKFIVGQTQHQASLIKNNYHRELTDLVRNFHPLPCEALEKDEQVKVLWIANIKKIKQPELFLKLADDLSHLNAQFIMMGGAQGEATWRDKTISKMKITPNINYLGALPQNEVNSLLATSHLLVNTSQYEGFSNTFIQAWMRRVPVISYNVDPDQLLNETGLGACAEGDYQRLVKQLEELILDGAKRDKMGLKAQKYANEFHSEKNVERLVSLF